MSSGRVEKSPHEQEIKFFAKVRLLIVELYLRVHFRTLLLVILHFVLFFPDPSAISQPVL